MVPQLSEVNQITWPPMLSPISFKVPKYRTQRFHQRASGQLWGFLRLAKRSFAASHKSQDLKNNCQFPQFCFVRLTVGPQVGTESDLIQWEFPPIHRAMQLTCFIKVIHYTYTMVFKLGVSLKHIFGLQNTKLSWHSIPNPNRIINKHQR